MTENNEIHQPAEKAVWEDAAKKWYKKHPPISNM